MQRACAITGAALLLSAMIGNYVNAAEVKGMTWLAQETSTWTETKAKLQSLGEQFPTSEALFEHLRKEASDGTSLDPAALPDWRGVWTRTKGGLSFDPDLKASDGATSATLTKAGQEAVDKKIHTLTVKGGEYDRISACSPPGTPRWITEPFLKEFVVTPDQTWLMNEMVNDVRRIYTDGRAHSAAEDSYPSWNGDSIGFWDGDILTIHTKYLREGDYQRGLQPDYSDQVELVERWHKVNDMTIEADTWAFDPVNLAKPWYTRQSWTKIEDPDHVLRLRYWDCGENQNNQVIKTEEGTSQFSDFNFVDDDAAVSSDPNVKRAAGDKAKPANQ